jgi:hypothetical protein
MSHYIEIREAPAGRKKHCEAGKEQHLTEGAVMIAFAMYLFDQGANEVELHPDGEHGKRFDVRGCLQTLGFAHVSARGTTAYGGFYQRRQQKLTITLTPGLGDVVANIGGQILVAECKGGIVNTRHPGQSSKLRRGLCEAVGLLMARSINGERHVAVVPATPVTQKIATRMFPRIHAAGIEIALVDKDGVVTFPAVTS